MVELSTGLPVAAAGRERTSISPTSWPTMHPSHSSGAADGGWTWKFDTNAMSGRRFGEPFNEHLAAANCRCALIYAADSALVTAEMARYMNGLMGPDAPMVVIPAAQHHLTLDQPLALVAALRTLLDVWQRADAR